MKKSKSECSESNLEILEKRITPRVEKENDFREKERTNLSHGPPLCLHLSDLIHQTYKLYVMSTINKSQINHHPPT